MGLIRKSTALVLSVLAIAGCTIPTSPALDNLREQFTVAGGICSEWTPIDEPFAVAAATCVEGATLVVFDSTADRADFIKSELETNGHIRARTHIIVSKDTWLVIDTVAVIVRVMPRMGGIISGRNAANP